MLLVYSNGTPKKREYAPSILKETENTQDQIPQNAIQTNVFAGKRAILR